MSVHFRGQLGVAYGVSVPPVGKTLPRLAWRLRLHPLPHQGAGASAAVQGKPGRGNLFRRSRHCEASSREGALWNDSRFRPAFSFLLPLAPPRPVFVARVRMVATAVAAAAC